MLFYPITWPAERVCWVIERGRLRLHPMVCGPVLYLLYNPALRERARSLRCAMAPTEQKLWKRCLRHFPYRVLRQRPIDNFIVDFYCAALRLVIEVDGECHTSAEAQARDAERTRILEGYGLRVIRFTNEQVLRDLEGVCAVLVALAEDPSTYPW